MFEIIVPTTKLTLAKCAFLQILPLTGLHLDADQSATLTKGLATNGVNFTAPFRPYVFLSEWRKHFKILFFEKQLSLKKRA